MISEAKPWCLVGIGVFNAFSALCFQLEMGFSGHDSIVSQEACVFSTSCVLNAHLPTFVVGFLKW